MCRVRSRWGENAPWLICSGTNDSRSPCIHASIRGRSFLDLLHAPPSAPGDLPGSSALAVAGTIVSPCCCVFLHPKLEEHVIPRRDPKGVPGSHEHEERWPSWG